MPNKPNENSNSAHGALLASVLALVTACDLSEPTQQTAPTQPTTHVPTQGPSLEQQAKALKQQIKAIEDHSRNFFVMEVRSNYVPHNSVRAMINGKEVVLQREAMAALLEADKQLKADDKPGVDVRFSYTGPGLSREVYMDYGFDAGGFLLRVEEKSVVDAAKGTSPHKAGFAVDVPKGGSVEKAIMINGEKYVLPTVVADEIQRLIDENTGAVTLVHYTGQDGNEKVFRITSTS